MPCKHKTKQVPSPGGGSHLAEDNLALLELDRLQRVHHHLLVLLHARKHSIYRSAELHQGSRFRVSLQWWTWPS